MLLFVWFMSVWIFYFFYFQISAIFHINVPGLRRRRPEEYDMHNRKRPRIDYTPEFPQRPGFMQDPRNPPVDRRFSGVRRDVFLNGSYNDYMREFHHSIGPPPPWQGMAPYPGMDHPPQHPY